MIKNAGNKIHSNGASSDILERMETKPAFRLSDTNTFCPITTLAVSALLSVFYTGLDDALNSNKTMLPIIF